MEYNYELRIPKERVAILIGIKGKIKKEIEEITKCKIDIDSQEGDVLIMGTDPVTILSAREIVKAVGRGFNPEMAMQLRNPEYAFEIIDITNYTGKNKKAEIRMKGRIIGTKGKARKIIEDLAEVQMCVYGKTISLIGEIQSVNMARKAVELILQGSPHATVYSWLEKQRKTFRAESVL